MKLLNILIFTALFLTIVSTLGFLGFSLIDHNMQFLCPISNIAGIECPAENVLNLASHHFLGLKFLTQFIISLSLLIIPVIFLMIFYLPDILEFLPNNFSRNKELSSVPFKKFFAFLARYNKQDAYSIY
ncbi:MAG: hypothetical protein UR15_C0023G0007 [Parcubacteria group bacterium GW2011_GWA2_31_28]|nr:MAG: hypothetical protein UR15_C0023G0007 [Parcubacteria group bacterium GW2011_GWA2_31_28]